MPNTFALRRDEALLRKARVKRTPALKHSSRGKALLNDVFQKPQTRICENFHNLRQMQVFNLEIHEKKSLIKACGYVLD